MCVIALITEKAVKSHHTRPAEQKQHTEPETADVPLSRWWRPKPELQENIGQNMSASSPSFHFHVLCVLVVFFARHPRVFLCSQEVQQTSAVLSQVEQNKEHIKELVKS